MWRWEGLLYQVRSVGQLYIHSQAARKRWKQSGARGPFSNPTCGPTHPLPEAAAKRFLEVVLSSPPPLSRKPWGFALLFTGTALYLLSILHILVQSCLHPYIPQTLLVRITKDLKWLKPIGNFHCHLIWMPPAQQHLVCSVTPSFFFFFNKFIYLFIYLIFGCTGSSLARGFSLVAESGGYSLLRCTGFSLRWLLLLQSTGARRTGFSSCGTRASVVVARRLSSCGAWA